MGAVQTAVAVADGHEAGARRALLERLATDLTVIADPATQWTCCWLSYDGPRGESWSWQMCGGQMPGALPLTPDGRYFKCGHWHHRHEIFMA
jgi:hypothetical protein